MQDYTSASSAREVELSNGIGSDLVTTPKVGMMRARISASPVLSITLICVLSVGCGDGSNPGGAVDPYADATGSSQSDSLVTGAQSSFASGGSADIPALKEAVREITNLLNGMSNEYEGLAGSGKQSIQLTQTEQLYQKMSPIESQLSNMQAPTAEEARTLKSEVLESLLNAIKRAEIAELHLERQYDFNSFGSFASFGGRGHDISDGISIARSALNLSQRNLPVAEKLTTGPPASIGGAPPTNRSFGYLRGLGVSEAQYRSISQRSPGKDPVPWQMQADPAIYSYELSEEAALEIDVPSTDSPPSAFYTPLRILYPQMPSLVVGLGLNERTGHQRVIWELDPKKRIGVVKSLQLQDSHLMALSPDGRYFAAQPEKTNIIGLYDIDQKKPVAQTTHEVPLGGTAYLMFGADNRLVLYDGAVAKVWTVPNLELEHTIEIGRDARRSVWYPGTNWALSPGGRYLAVPGSAGFAYDIMIYDLTTGRPAAQIDMSGSRSISHVASAFSRDGTKLAVLMDGSWNTWIQIWDIVSGRLLASYENEGSLSRAVDGERKYQGPAVDWFPDGKRILLYGKGVFNTETGSGEKFLTSNVLYRIGLLSDQHIGVVQRDVFDTFDLEEVPINLTRWNSEQLASEAMVADNPFEITPTGGKNIATVTDRSQVRYVHVERQPLWNLHPDPAQNLSASTGQINGFTGQNVYHVALTPSENMAVAGYTNQAIRVWNGKTSDLDKLKSWVEYSDISSGSRPERFDFSFPSGFHGISPSGKFVVTRDLEGFNRFDLWDLESKSHVAGFFPYDQGRSDGGAPILWCEFLDDNHLYTMAEKQLTLWSIPDGKAVYEVFLDSVQNWPVFSPGRKQLALLEGGGLTVISTESGDVLARGDQLGLSGKLSAVAFSADGASLALLSSPPGGGEMAVIDTATGQPMTSFPLPMSGKTLQWYGEDFVLVDGGYLVSIDKKSVAWIYNLEGLRIASQGGERNWFLSQIKSNDPYQLLSTTLPTSQLVNALATADPPIDLLLQPGGSIALDIQVPTPPNRGGFSQEVSEAMTRQFASHNVRIDPSAPLRLVIRGEHGKTGDGISLGHYGSLFSRDSDLDEERVTWTLSIRQGEQTLWQRSSSSNNTGSVDIEDGVTGDAAIQQAATQLRERMWSNAAASLLKFQLPKYVFGQNAGRGLGSSKLGSSL
ncbi:WD40 repeat domain-containing protein [Thalassoglobus sp. JC818]|uniref:WD40 repeat domain-containing protein n=1 Tax=Thalassoglobus sp. JC818 TaxID=3232136 RepID=UPI0034582339